MTKPPLTFPLAGCLAMLSSLLLQPICYAQESASNSEDNWGLGLAVMSRQKPYRDFDNKIEVMPMLALENRWIRIAGPGIDLKLGKTGAVSYALTANYSNDGYKASDSSYLAGMDKRSAGIWLGGRINWNTGFANFSASWQADASGNSQGQKIRLGADHRFAFDKFGITPRLAAIWQDRKYVDYYYGVTAGEERADRPQYAGTSAVNTELGIRTDYRLSNAQSLFADLSVSTLGSGIKDSPLVSGSTESAFRLGYMYRF